MILVQSLLKLLVFAVAFHYRLHCYRLEVDAGNIVIDVLELIVNLSLL